MSLDRLGDDLAAAFRRREASEAAARGRRRRRAATVGIVATLLAAPTAVATRSFWEPAPVTRDPLGPPKHRSPAILLTGRGPSEEWRLTAVRDRRGPCVLLALPSVTRVRSFDCAAPEQRPGTLDAHVLNGRHDGFVFGLVPRSIVRVTVAANGLTQHVRPIAPEPTVLRRAGLHEGLAVYVDAFGDQIEFRDGIDATAVDARGDTIARYQLRR